MTTLFWPKGAFRFWQRNAFIFRRIFPESVAVNFLEPVIYLLAMGLGLGAYLRVYLQRVRPDVLREGL